MPLVVLCLVTLTFLLFILWYRFLPRNRYALALLLPLSALLWFLIRFGFGRIWTTFDEAYYLSTIKVGGVYSGVLTPLMLRGAYRLFHDPVLSLLALSFVLFMLYPLVLLRFYGVMGVRNPTKVVLILFISSYFLWTANAFRPQQFGVPVGLLTFVMHWKPLKHRTLEIPLWASLWLVLMLTHVLSFLVFFTLILILSSVDVALERINLRRALTETLTALPAVVLFLRFPMYSETVYSMKWMLKHSSLAPLRFAGWNLPWLLPLLFICISLVPVVFGWMGERIKRICGEFVGIINKRPKVTFWLLLSASVVALLVQFWLGRSVYTSVYRTTWFLPIMQAGNLLFAVLLIWGIIKNVGNWEPFDRGSVVMLLLGAFGLILSLMMPSGYGSFGFRNWTVRVLQYLVFLGAPVVARVLRIPRRIPLKVGVTVLITILSVVSVLNVARPHPIYDYPYYWTSNDIKLVKNAGPGLVYEINLSTIPNAITLSFLGWAYGFRLVPIGRGSRYAAHPQVCSGGLCYSPFPYRLTPIDSMTEKAGLSTGKMSPSMRELAVSMLTTHGFRISANAGTILVLGNASTNPLIRRLQSSYLVPVVINFSIVTGPDFVVYHAIHAGRRSCDAWMAYFVVESVEVNGSNIVVISGPNYDAVFAGLWWLVRNGTKSGLSYVVGMWMEKDGRVLKPLSCGPNDRNGFSFGDEVRISTGG